MKKFLIFLFTLTLLTFPACSVGGADTVESESDTEAETLVPVHEWDCDNIPQALASEIRTAYAVFLNATVEGSYYDPYSPSRVFVNAYFGNYSGCELVAMGGVGIQPAMRATEIAGYRLVFASSQRIYAYKNGAFYILKDAYDIGLLTKEDIYGIGQKAASEITELSADQDRDTTDTLIPVHKLDCDNIGQALASELKTSYCHALRAIYPQNYKADEIWVQAYFGNYNGCEIVYMGCDLQYTDAMRPIEIAGYTIFFGSSQRLYAYKDGTFHILKDAYDGGLLTKQDIYNIGKAVDPQFTETYPNP